MATNRQIYGEVNSKTGLKNVFTAIRRDVNRAGSRSALTELYRRAGYLITLTHSPAWKEKFRRGTHDLAEIGAEEFRKTARKINRRARQINTRADYDEDWGE